MPQSDDRSEAVAAQRATPRPDGRAAELLDQAIAHLQTTGLEGFSLASLASALGTSSRMLIYHLGSRDEILGKVQAAMRRKVIKDMRDRRFERLADAVQASWDFYVVRLSHMEVFYHLASRAFEEPGLLPEFLETAVAGWVDFYAEVAVREGYAPADVDPAARMTLATFRGLILDLALTGDLKRTSRAMKLFTERLSESSPAAA